MEKEPSRRSFIKKSMIAGSAIAATGCAGTAGINKNNISLSGGFPEKLTEPLPKGLEYILKVRGMIRSVLAEDSVKIEKSAQICADAIMNSKKVYYNDTGHGESQCVLETIGGKPSFLNPLFGGESHKVIDKDDVLISPYTSRCTEANKKGAKTIGIIMAFEPKKFQGQGIVNRDFKGPYMEDICDVWFWDRTPFTIGILDFNLMPWKAIAAHGIMDSVILKLIAAKTVDILLAKGVKVETV